jgi:bacillithiol biosynthesis cysteine-adding enzyme BshC
VSSDADLGPDAGAVRASVDLERLPWIRPLVSAYTNDFPSVAALFAGDPSDASAWRDALARVQRAPRDRAAIGRIVAAQLEAREAPEAARLNAARLSEPATVAILTGQQAGLFGGPLYTLHKAVTTIQIARRIAAEHRVAVVPVFWVEGEDHDWAEVRSTSVLDPDFQLRTIALADPPGAGRLPVAAITLDDGIDEAFATLKTTLAPTAFTDDLLARLRRCYHPGTSVARAFAAWLDVLLGGEGLVVFEAADPAAKPLLRELFMREVESPGRTATLARQGGEAMARLGHAPQVEPADASVSLFYLNGQGRSAIKPDGGGFTIAGARHEAAALQAEAQAHPERFSPNVLLRPLAQDRLFPTICYVGGPSELAYQAQLREVYPAFSVEPPLLVARASATLLDGAAIRFLERSGVPFEALHSQDDSALNALLQRLLPPAIDDTLEALDQAIAAHLERLREPVGRVDATLAGALDTTRDRLRDTLKTLHGKIVQAAKRKDETLRRQFERTRALAFPGGQPQERALGIVFFVNRYGPALGSRLLDILPLDGGRHYLVTP